MALEGPWKNLRAAFDKGDLGAVIRCRDAPSGPQTPPDPAVMEIIDNLYSKSLDRLPQTELAAVGLGTDTSAAAFQSDDGSDLSQV